VEYFLTAQMIESRIKVTLPYRVFEYGGI